ncbi:MAG: AAA family ATPase, partial [Verrucomicrobiaceae bacterium]
MTLSKNMRLLQTRWNANNGWPKRLDSLAITGLRGWTGQRVEFKFPITAICGENGSGKSTILQAAASAYSSPTGKKWFASDFFPDTTWDTLKGVEIGFSLREGDAIVPSSVRKLTDRWRGNPERRLRSVIYVDLSRIQPVGTRVGYARLAKNTWKEVGASHFEDAKTTRLSQIMGRQYESAKMALTDGDDSRTVPVLSINGNPMSGYHQGTGECTIAELLSSEIQPHSLLIIDEIETALHPRAQRRLMGDLAALCRDKEIQVILSTHSPYILSELPPDGRAYIMQNGGNREVIHGVSPSFAMAKMDDEHHPECDVYVEDVWAGAMLREIVIATNADLIPRIQIIPYGGAGVGQSLGMMAHQNRFPRPTVVTVDGDQKAFLGCVMLPGGDAPEHVVFEGLSGVQWADVYQRVGRGFSDVAEACSRAMLTSDHHLWLSEASNALFLTKEILWQAMCSEWATKVLAPERASALVDSILIAIENFSFPTASLPLPAQSPTSAPAIEPPPEP